MRELYKPLTEKLVARQVAAVMYQGDALLLGELESIQSQNLCDAASELLDSLLRQSDACEWVVECFMDALKITGQEHIFLWISYPGIKQCKIILLRML